MAAPPTTIDSLPVKVLTEVLLRVPTSAALVHAAAASRSWRDAIAKPEFLATYRERHKSSPFLGLYVPRQFAEPPSFHMPDSIRLADDDALALDLKAAALRAFDFGEIRRYADHRFRDAVDNAFVLGRLRVHPYCRLLDCHNSRLLLTRGNEALEVRSPLACESVVLPFPPDVVYPDSFEACLLQGHDKAASSFQVVYLQHRRQGHNRQVRAVEYDFTRKSWQDHTWYTIKNIEGLPEEVMHAGHRLFCIYSGRSQAALMLDTRKMEFSILPLPTAVNFAIGEVEDSVCCLVESVGRHGSMWLKVWRLEEKKLEWKHNKDISLDQVLAKHVQYHFGYYRPRAIRNGIALVCSTTLSHHFVLDLNTCSLMDKFEFKGRSAYIMQMPWPPAFSHPTVNAAGGFDRDGELVSVGDARTVAGESDEIEGLLGGAPVLAEEPMHMDPYQTRPEPSHSPSLGCCFSTDPSQEATMARLLDLSSIACSVLGTSYRSQDTTPATAPPTDLLTTSSLAEYMEDQQRLASTMTGLPSCPQQGRKRAGSRKSKGSPEAMGPGRHNRKPKSKYLEAILASFSIASKVNAMESNSSRAPEEDTTNPTSRVNGAKERKRKRDRARWHAMSQEKRNEKNKRRREAYMKKQKQRPNIKNINVIGSYHPERRMSLIRLEQGARCHPKYYVKDPEVNAMESNCSRAPEGDTTNTTSRVDDARERRRERDRARWHAMSQEKRNEKNKRRREAYMTKQKQRPNIKKI